jgi:hypothetical protein
MLSGLVRKSLSRVRAAFLRTTESVSRAVSTRYHSRDKKEERGGGSLRDGSKARATGEGETLEMAVGGREIGDRHKHKH